MFVSGAAFEVEALAKHFAGNLRYNGRGCRAARRRRHQRLRQHHSAAAALSYCYTNSGMTNERWPASRVGRFGSR